MLYGKTETYAGLGTMTLQVPATGPANIKGKITLPNQIEGAPASQVVVTVNYNGGSPIYTGRPGDEGFETGGYATAGSVFNVILTSSQASDQGANAVKTTVSLY